MHGMTEANGRKGLRHLRRRVAAVPNCGRGDGYGTEGAIGSGSMVVLMQWIVHDGNGVTVQQGGRGTTRERNECHCYGWKLF